MKLNSFREDIRAFIRKHPFLFKVVRFLMKYVRKTKQILSAFFYKMRNRAVVLKRKWELTRSVVKEFFLIRKEDYQLLIIWNNALYKEEKIEKDLKKNFLIIKKIMVKWDEKFMEENFLRFYSHSLTKFPEEDIDNIVKAKVEHCGTGEFRVFILQDLSPRYRVHKISAGEALVNTKIFNLKNKYRKWTGGGHKIHATDDRKEFEKDMALLFGIKKSIRRLPNVVDSNVLGLEGWNSIEELFYVLNRSVKYVVLRNYECLPKKYTLENHGDIDLLLSDLRSAVYLTGGKKAFPEDYRVHYFIKIKEEQIPFDFRFVGDNYYDKKWQEEILNSRRNNNGIYVPSQKNYFYSLLYHALIHKLVVSNDYIAKFNELSKLLKIKIRSELFNEKEMSLILRRFLRRHRYRVVKPIDESVGFKKLLA